MGRVKSIYLESTLFPQNIPLVRSGPMFPLSRVRLACFKINLSRWPNNNTLSVISNCPTLSPEDKLIYAAFKVGFRSGDFSHIPEYRKVTPLALGQLLICTRHSWSCSSLILNANIKSWNHYLLVLCDTWKRGANFHIRLFCPAALSSPNLSQRPLSLSHRTPRLL